ncbi:uncharacterized protein [Argopecten irradians]|uniref:uncharacterized protein n=1 Tax=Argopecten irradians TaxID=31199 RepID=UPI003717128B
MADDHPWLSYFDDVDKTNPYRGIVSDIDDINDVVREFSYHTSTTYTVTRCTKNFGHFSLEQSFAGEHSVRFKDEGKVGHRCTIPSNGAPFMIVGLKLMECHQGPQHRTKVSKDTSQSTEHGYSLMSSRKRLTGTKKKGCPAAIVMREVIHFDEYMIPCDTPYSKEVKSAELRNDFFLPAMRKFRRERSFTLICLKKRITRTIYWE